MDHQLDLPGVPVEHALHAGGVADIQVEGAELVVALDVSTKWRTDSEPISPPEPVTTASGMRLAEGRPD